MLTITDPLLIEKLQARAASENRSVEAVLYAIIDPPAPSARRRDTDDEIEARLQAFHRRIYQQARDYWRSVGDEERASLTDAQLDELFGAFDEQGVPRFKSELSPVPLVGSLAYAGWLIEQEGGVNAADGWLIADEIRDILRQGIADKC